MNGRRAFTIVLAVLAVASAACGSPSTDSAPTTAPLTTPEAVAGAFAAAYAAGDTPTACTYTSGRAKENMTEGGSVSLCSHSAWAAQDYWLSDHCVIPGTNGDEYTYIYRANGTVGSGNSFVISVTGTAPFYTVTSYAAGSFAQTGGICAAADRILQSSSGGPSS